MCVCICIATNQNFSENIENNWIVCFSFVSQRQTAVVWLHIFSLTHSHSQYLFAFEVCLSREVCLKTLISTYSVRIDWKRVLFQYFNPNDMEKWIVGTIIIMMIGIFTYWTASSSCFTLILVYKYYIYKSLYRYMWLIVSLFKYASLFYESKELLHWLRVHFELDIPFRKKV